VRLKPVKPMMATAARTLPTGVDWSYEVKWDGYRAQIVKDGSRLMLASRNIKDITETFGGVAQAAAGLAARDAIVDGEIVALDAEGHPSFQALHHASTEGLAVVFYAFDLLHLNGKDLTKTPLDGRRAALAPLVAGSALLLSEPLPGTSSEIAAAVRQLGLEGVVAKRRQSRYEPGRRSDAWIKVRFATHQELIVGGYKPSPGGFDSLVVGYYEGKRLLSAGKVRNGFTPNSRALVFERLRRLIVRRCPFANLPTGRTSHWGEGITEEEMKELVWVKPIVIVELAFTEWTRDGSLRHAAFVGVRDDKLPRDVRREALG
jgi:bifunctional non-homologous end joining protein LigD